MTGQRFSMDGYVSVSERIDAFMAKYPEGCLQSEITHLTDTGVVVKAYAYRTPGDVTPGIGHSALEIPGRTPYTRGSEIENAETSAWGRALAALGFAANGSVASADEVRAKREDTDGPRPPVARGERPAFPNVGAFLTWCLNEKKMNKREVCERLKVDEREFNARVTDFEQAADLIEGKVAAEAPY